MQYAKKKKRGICHLCGAKAPRYRSYCARCAKKRAAKARAERRSRIAKCITCGAEFVKFRRRIYCESCADTNSPRYKAYQRRWRVALKLEVFKKYGGAKCRCCGEREVCFLTLDHIDGSGAVHRRKLRTRSVYHLFVWLRQQGYPAGFQVLCCNCNRGRWMNGGICPHKMKEK